MILVISVCKEKLSELEFVAPVAALVTDPVVKHYKEITEEDLTKADKVIICGTALKDFDYLENLNKFGWIKAFKKPVLGICAGFQIIAVSLGKELVDELSIGQKEKSYYLHSKTIKGKETIKENNLTGYIFHPEVLNEELIKGF